MRYRLSTNAQSGNKQAQPLGNKQSAVVRGAQTPCATTACRLLIASSRRWSKHERTDGENILRLILNPKTKSGRVPPYDQELKFVMLCRARRLDPVLFTGLSGYEGSNDDQWTHEIWIPR
jgi:hypothetical protein